MAGRLIDEINGRLGGLAHEAYQKALERCSDFQVAQQRFELPSRAQRAAGEIVTLFAGSLKDYVHREHVTESNYSRIHSTLLRKIEGEGAGVFRAAQQAALSILEQGIREAKEEKRAYGEAQAAALAEEDRGKKAGLILAQRIFIHAPIPPLVGEGVDLAINPNRF